VTDAAPAAANARAAITSPSAPMTATAQCATLIRELRATKRRYMTLCYRFQELRFTYAHLSAALAADAPSRHKLVGEAVKAFPVYGFATGASGVVSLVPRPRLTGGGGRSDFDCWEEPAPEATVLYVEGEIDIATAPLFADAIAAAFDRSARLIIHLGGLRYLDGAGIHVLEDAHATWGRGLVVVGSAPHVHRLFNILDLTQVFPVVETLEAARAYLRER
jgi:anti-sigma B factor antagonist